MLKWLRRFRNFDRIDHLERTMETYREANKALEEQVREYKGYKLKYELARNVGGSLGSQFVNKFGSPNYRLINKNVLQEMYDIYGLSTNRPF